MPSVAVRNDRSKSHRGVFAHVKRVLRGKSSCYLWTRWSPKLRRGGTTTRSLTITARTKKVRCLPGATFRRAFSFHADLGQLAPSGGNLVGIMSRNVLRGANFKNVTELRQAIEAFIAANNPNANKSRSDPAMSAPSPTLPPERGPFNSQKCNAANAGRHGINLGATCTCDRWRLV